MIDRSIEQMLLVAGRYFQLIMLIVLILVVYVGFEMAARKGRVKVRLLPQVSAIKEMVERCAEMNRPITFVPGGSSVAGTTGASIGSAHLASLSIIAEVAYQCGLTGAKVLVLAASPVLIPLYNNVLQAGFIRSGHPEGFEPNAVRFSTPELYSYAAWVAGEVRRENAGANMIVGSHNMDAMIHGIAGLEVGAMQLAGPSFAYFFVAVADYVFIGPDLYVASAYLTEDPILLGSIRGMDLTTFVILGMAFIGLILATARSDLLLKLFGW